MEDGVGDGGSETGGDYVRAVIRGRGEGGALSTLVLNLECGDVGSASLSLCVCGWSLGFCISWIL